MSRSNDTAPVRAKKQAAMARAAEQRARKRIFLIVGCVALVAVGVLGVMKYLHMRKQLLRLEARITHTSGQVTMVLPSGKSDLVTEGDLVPQGAILRTGAGIEADVGFLGGGGIKLDSDTEVTMSRLYDDEGDREIEIDIQKGRLFNKVRGEGAKPQYKLATPSGQMIVRGTEFFVETDGPSSLVATRTGKVEVALNASAPVKPLVEVEQMVFIDSGILGPVEPVGIRERRLFAQLDRIHELNPDGTIAELAGFTNSLGMPMIPLKIDGGTTDQEIVMFAAHEVRTKDFAEFIAATQPDSDGNEPWRNHLYRGQPVGRAQGEAAEESDHPAVMIAWDEANAFCEWLSEKDGRIYRLPSDHEWSCAVGIGSSESGSKTPKEKNLRIPNRFPWGNRFSREEIVGNYSDETAKAAFGEDWEHIVGYEDGFATTAPVMSFEPNELGLFDMGGNVWEWTLDQYGSEGRDRGWRTLRGGSWYIFHEEGTLSSYRIYGIPNYRWNYVGFRVVEVIPDSSSDETAMKLESNSTLAASFFDRPGDREGWSEVSFEMGMIPEGEPMLPGIHSEGVVGPSYRLQWFSDGREGGHIAFLESASADGRMNYVRAPEKFLGDQSSIYGGSIELRLKQVHEGFLGEVANVVLRSGDLFLTHSIQEPKPKEWRSFSIPMEEISWKLNDRDSFHPTQDEMEKILSDLDEFLIRVELGNGRDLSELDNIEFVSADEKERRERYRKIATMIDPDREVIFVPSVRSDSIPIDSPTAAPVEEEEEEERALRRLENLPEPARDFEPDSEPDSEGGEENGVEAATELNAALVGTTWSWVASKPDNTFRSVFTFLPDGKVWGWGRHPFGWQVIEGKVDIRFGNNGRVRLEVDAEAGTLAGKNPGQNAVIFGERLGRLPEAESNAPASEFYQDVARQLQVEIAYTDGSEREFEGVKVIYRGEDILDSKKAGFWILRFSQDGEVEQEFVKHLYGDPDKEFEVTKDLIRSVYATPQDRVVLVATGGAFNPALGTKIKSSSLFVGGEAHELKYLQPYLCLGYPGLGRGEAIELFGEVIDEKQRHFGKVSYDGQGVGTPE